MYGPMGNHSRYLLTKTKKRQDNNFSYLPWSIKLGGYEEGVNKRASKEVVQGRLKRVSSFKSGRKINTGVGVEV